MEITLNPLINRLLEVFIILRHQILENADSSGNNILEDFGTVRCGSGGGCTANYTIFG